MTLGIAGEAPIPNRTKAGDVPVAGTAGRSRAPRIAGTGLVDLRRVPLDPLREESSPDTNVTLVSD